jgi:hypothetical protein
VRGDAALDDEADAEADVEADEDPIVARFNAEDESVIEAVSLDVLSGGTA